MQIMAMASALSRSTQQAVLQNSCSTVGIFAGKVDPVLCLAGKMKCIFL